MKDGEGLRNKEQRVQETDIVPNLGLVTIGDADVSDQLRGKGRYDLGGKWFGQL